ncbi:YjjG family noncanonical pyrimidine nucleotidase [bacterium]|nr:YjjG family noncanonical pyrimidine nucleotidase [candidate division CSSED10-310 bacterium]
MSRIDMLPTYRAILFDLDNTLFDYDSSAQAALIGALEEIGRVADGDDRSALRADIYADYHHINAELWKQLENGELDLNELRIHRFQRLFDHRGWSDTDWETFSRRYLDRLASDVRMLPGACRVLTALHHRYTLGVLTNGIAGVQRERIRLSGLAGCFTAVVISGEYGFAKPDPRIFSIALDHLHSPRSQTLFVGDSVTSDMAGADRAGIDFCWFNPENTPHPGMYTTRYCIRRLDDLLDILAENQEIRDPQRITPPS